MPRTPVEKPTIKDLFMIPKHIVIVNKLRNQPHFPPSYNCRLIRDGDVFDCFDMFIYFRSNTSYEFRWGGKQAAKIVQKYLRKYDKRFTWNNFLHLINLFCPIAMKKKERIKNRSYYDQLKSRNYRLLPYQEKWKRQREIMEKVGYDIYY